MATVQRFAACPPERVFEVISDGWLFPSWVVGASRMRAVGADWPQEGSQLAHSFGVWPAVIDDKTTVLEFDPPRRVVLRPGGWPLGEARVTIEVAPRHGGCLITMDEFAESGPGSVIPTPLLNLVLIPRNREALRRLVFLAEGREHNHEHHENGS